MRKAGTLTLASEAARHERAAAARKEGGGNEIPIIDGANGRLHLSSPMYERLARDFNPLSRKPSTVKSYWQVIFDEFGIRCFLCDIS